ncbi:hypothetical protein B0H12DRAFT_373108 [Mycena haematopus]|nr:hypothetical protein B0H12DRAFT_373108 [Mycena haematopus]
MQTPKDQTQVLFLPRVYFSVYTDICFQCSSPDSFSMTTCTSLAGPRRSLTSHPCLHTRESTIPTPRTACIPAAIMDPQVASLPRGAQACRKTYRVRPRPHCCAWDPAFLAALVDLPGLNAAQAALRGRTSVENDAHAHSLPSQASPRRSFISPLPLASSSPRPPCPPYSTCLPRPIDIATRTLIDPRRPHSVFPHLYSSQNTVPVGAM